MSSLFVKFEILFSRSHFPLISVFIFSLKTDSTLISLRMRRMQGSKGEEPFVIRTKLTLLFFRSSTHNSFATTIAGSVTPNFDRFSSKSSDDNLSSGFESVVLSAESKSDDSLCGHHITAGVPAYEIAN